MVIIWWFKIEDTLKFYWIPVETVVYLIITKFGLAHNFFYFINAFLRYYLSFSIRHIGKFIYHFDPIALGCPQNGAKAKTFKEKQNDHHLSSVETIPIHLTIPHLQILMHLLLIPYIGRIRMPVLISVKIFRHILASVQYQFDLQIQYIYWYRFQ